MRTLDGRVFAGDAGAMQQDGGDYRRGLTFAFLAYALWGLLPIYFRSVSSIHPVEVLSHRVTWSCILILGILAARREVGRLLDAMRDARILAALTTSAILIGLNWMVYIWAVMQGHVVAASLAYFLNPLVNVLLGVAFLGERLRSIQWFAIGLAAAGVAILGAGAPETLGISLFLAISFALYGLVRKLTPVQPLVGLGIETLVLVPPALTGFAWTASHGDFGFGQHVDTTALLIASGLVTSAPLLLFAAAARVLPMVTLGLIQYVCPTMLFLTAVLLFGEQLTPAKWATFALIWTGLFIFAGHALYSVRAARTAAA